VRRRYDGSTFDQPYTGGMLPETGDLWPSHLGVELSGADDYHHHGEMVQGRDGWRRRDERDRPNRRGPETYIPKTHGGDFDGE
jgi:hypothetical protein